MDWELVFRIYLIIGAAHAIVWSFGSAQKYREVWYAMPSFILCALAIIVLAWPAFVLANGAMAYRWIKQRRAKNEGA